jgi:hypothetical protein
MTGAAFAAGLLGESGEKTPASSRAWALRIETLDTSRDDPSDC